VAPVGVGLFGEQLVDESFEPDHVLVTFG